MTLREGRMTTIQLNFRVNLTDIDIGADARLDYTVHTNATNSKCYP